MKNTLLIPSVFGILFLLSGCVSTERTKVVSIDPSLIQVCKVAEPPDRMMYLLASWRDKERMLVDSLLDHYNYVGECNIRLIKAQEQLKRIEAVK